MKRSKIILLTTVVMIIAVSSCKKDVLETTELSPAGKYHSLQDFYDQNGVATQTFFIYPDQNNIIAGDSGTIIGIAPNSLVDNSGFPPSGVVKVTMREIYDIKSMVLSHRPTTSNGTILKSGGMFYLEFSANNVSYKPDTVLGAAMPSDTGMLGMKVYYGQPDLDYGINWIIDSSSVVIDTLNSHAFSFDSLSYGWMSVNKVFPIVNPADVAITPIVNTERGEPVDLAVYLLFPSVNSVMNVSNTSSQQSVTAHNIPIGMQAVAAVVGIGRITNKAYFGKTNFTVTSPQNVSVNVSQMTDQQIFDSLANL